MRERAKAKAVTRNPNVSMCVLDESVRPLVVQGAKTEDRVVLRLRPYATFETPPRHVHDESDINPSLTHWTSTSLPWRDDTEAV